MGLVSWRDWLVLVVAYLLSRSVTILRHAASISYGAQLFIPR